MAEFNDQELEIVSIIAKILKEELPSMPMDIATRYAKKILASLHDEGWIVRL